MDIRQGIQALQKQIDKMDTLAKPPAYNPQYKIWEDTTLRILRACFDESYIEMFEYAGPSQVAWSDEHYYQMYLETLTEKKQLLEGFIEEYKTSLETPVDISKPTLLSDYDFHPIIKETSQKLFEDRHYGESVRTAFIRIISEVQSIMLEKVGTVDRSADSMMNKAFACANRDPVIKFNNLSSQAEKDEQQGIMYLFKGIVGVRNRKAHEIVRLDDPMRAIEYLALGSLLMRLLDLSKAYE